MLVPSLHRESTDSLIRPIEENLGFRLYVMLGFFISLCVKKAFCEHKLFAMKHSHISYE